MPEIYGGEEYTQNFKKCIIKVLRFLCQKTNAAAGRQVGVTPSYIQLGIDFPPTAAPETMLVRIQDYLEI